MKLGVNVGYWGLGMGPQEQLQIVQEAERLGYDSVWAAEAYGSDALPPMLAWLAAGTTHGSRSGSGIFQMPGRSAAMTAMTGSDDRQRKLSGGRMLLGIGTSGPPGRRGLQHGQRSAGRFGGLASTSRSCARRSAAGSSSTTGRRWSCPCPTGRARR